ncbi:MAG: adenylosuccinate lyase [bacterium]|nr:adenylosuccinate lyase [bacterium]MBU1918917.1 adenylosuccinate lyase [bacterium]
MIERYSRQEMAKIWEPENKFNIWLQIELLALEGWVKLGKVPKEVLTACQKKAKFDVKRIDEIEAEVKHDVIAFLTNVNENVGEEARYLHKGMTSSDVLDTCFAYQLKQTSEILLKDLDDLLEALKKRAYEHKNTVRIGRSHGIHAEPTTFGIALAMFYDEFNRSRKRLEEAAQQVAVGKISGAVGTFANIEPQVEEHVCNKMGLIPANVSTQIVQRDHHAHYFTTLAIIASSLEKLAVEIRHLQRTEVYEAEEFFSKGQKGSSAMPHKRNPILTENVTGLARVLRGYAVTAMENVALWHERDISHSSAERIIAPDATVLLDFMLHRMTKVVDQLLVYPENMLKNLNQHKGLYNSQRILLALTEKGCSREEAYKLVQKNAMKVWEEGKDFLEELSSDVGVTTHLPKEELKALFDLNYHTKHVDTIFNRVFK